VYDSQRGDFERRPTAHEGKECRFSGESGEPLPGQSDSSSFKLALPLLGVLLLYPACTTAIRPEANAPIRSVSIDKGVKVQVPSRESREPLKKAMRDSGIDPGEIFRKQFENELRSARVFPSILSEGGDAEVRLVIVGVGFEEPFPGNPQLKPHLDGKGTLVRPDGSVVWEGTSYVTTLNSETPSYTLDEYLKNRLKMCEALTAAAKVVSADLVKSLRESSPVYGSSVPVQTEASPPSVQADPCAQFVQAKPNVSPVSAKLPPTVTAPFFCWVDGISFTDEERFAHHLHGAHGVPLDKALSASEKVDGRYVFYGY